MAWTTPRTWTVGEILTAANLNTHLRDNMLVAAGAKAATISDLNTLWGGTPPDGALGTLRWGVSPYEFLGLVYDSTLGKWVSPSWYVTIGGSSEYKISNNTTVTTVSSVIQELTRNYAQAHTAGLKLQWRVTFRAWNDSSSFGYYAIQAYSVTPQATSVSGTSKTWSSATALKAMGTIPDSGNLTTSPSFFGFTATDETAWADLAAGVSTSRDIVGIQFQIQSNASPGNTNTSIDNMTVECRWVAQ
jgi:hypothetical protein